MLAWASTSLKVTILLFVLVIGGGLFLRAINEPRGPIVVARETGITEQGHVNPPPFPGSDPGASCRGLAVPFHCNDTTKPQHS